ncbi:MAG: hypothetical protein ACXWC2_03990 [Ramlibacter sp.]
MLLLPLQVRQWGAASTAQWSAAIAMASIMSASDLGLKAFGHAALGEAARAGLPPDASFTSIWAALRLLMGSIALLGVTSAWAVSTLGGAPVPVWLVWLVVAFAIEGLLLARIMYMDTLGLMVRAEGCYAMMLWLRLLTAATALKAFDASPATLAAIYASSALIGLAAQSFALRGHPALRLTAGGFGAITVDTFWLLRYSMAYPLANWCRISLPVLVLSTVAQAALVNAYVALRAVFGFLRAVVLHVGRYMSVQFMEAAALRRRRLLLWCIGSVVLCTAFALGVVLDAGALLSRWVPGISIAGYEWMSLSFSLAAPFFACEILLLTWMRDGGEQHVAMLHFVYVLLALLAASACLATKSLHVYLVAWLVVEVGFGATVLMRTRQYGVALPVFRTAASGIALVLLCFGAVQGTELLRSGQGFAHLSQRLAFFAALSGLMLLQLRHCAREPLGTTEGGA